MFFFYNIVKNVYNIYNVYQIKSHCRGGPAASLQHPGDDLMKPEYQWGFSVWQNQSPQGEEKVGHTTKFGPCYQSNTTTQY